MFEGQCENLGGGFNHFLCLTLPEEMLQFD